MNITFVIPALNPDNRLVDVVMGLIELGARDIVVVDDGSEEMRKKIFNTVSKKDECTVLVHDSNRGKGTALKTAFFYIQKNRPDIDGIVTLDADGQHYPKDAVRIAHAVLTSTEPCLVLGTRIFHNDAPLKSRFGNKLTQIVFRFFTGLNISDTQTGLRGFTRNLLSKMISVSGNAYEYEMRVLVELANENTTIKTVGIKTVYINNNESSHFNPVVDSILIYLVFIRFILSSVVSSLLDFILFLLFFLIFEKIFLSLIVARTLASLFNFYLNKRLVFRQLGRAMQFLFRYYALLVSLVLLGYLLITFLHITLDISVFGSKLIAEVLLFSASYYIQKKYVFSQ